MGTSGSSKVRENPFLTDAARMLPALIDKRMAARQLPRTLLARLASLPSSSLPDWRWSGTATPSRLACRDRSHSRNGSPENWGNLSHLDGSVSPELNRF